MAIGVRMAKVTGVQVGDLGQPVALFGGKALGDGDFARNRFFPRLVNVVAHVHGDIAEIPSPCGSRTSAVW